MELATSTDTYVVEEHGQQQVDHFVGNQDAAEHRSRHRLNDFGSRSACPEQRRQADHRRQFSQQLRTCAMHCSVHNGVAHFCQRHVFQPTVGFDRLAQVDQYDQAPFRGQSEASDIADPDSDAEIVAKEILEQYAPEDRSRDGEQ